MKSRLVFKFTSKKSLLIQNENQIQQPNYSRFFSCTPSSLLRHSNRSNASQEAYSAEDKLDINRSGAEGHFISNQICELYLCIQGGWSHNQSKIPTLLLNLGQRPRTSRVNTIFWDIRLEPSFKSIQITNNFSSKILWNYKTADELNHPYHPTELTTWWLFGVLYINFKGIQFVIITAYS